MSADANPCTTCGACCARFKVTFYSEDPEPNSYSFVSGQFERTLKSKQTSAGHPRCTSLQGSIGSQVRCGIYEKRPTPCRAFEPYTERCNEARRAMELAPLYLFQPSEPALTQDI